MGFGWFNCPPAGEAFRQDMAVPNDFWTVGSGTKRKPDAHAKHMALVKALTHAAQQEDRGLRVIQNPEWPTTQVGVDALRHSIKGGSNGESSD